MSEQIATITLRADVSDLKTANNELDKLNAAASSAAAGADKLADSAKRVKPATSEGTEGLKQQQQALVGLLEAIDPVTKSLNRLDEQQKLFNTFRGKGLVEDEMFVHYQKVLDDTRNKLLDTGEAAARAQLELATTQAAEKQSAALKNLLGSIDPTIRAFNSLDEQYSQLVAHFEAGRINASQFEHFNTQLEDTRRKLTGLADAMPEALNRQQLAAQKAGISIGQYNQALRTLPAQFTDIATQLAGGQSPFLILLQQGGQIKDQFGSVGGAVSGVGSYLRTLMAALTPATLGIGALTIGAGALATAWYKGTQEAAEFNRQLILTGNYSAQSANQLSKMAMELGGATGKVSVAARTLSQVVSVGTFKPAQLETITRAAMAMEEATGQSVDATIKSFQKLYASPTKASEELNSTMHYLTASQYEYISSLERRGDKEGAAEAAIKALSDAEQKRSQQIIDNMGLIERAANSTGNAIKGMWDKLLDIGRQDTAAQQLEKVTSEIANFKSGATGWGYAVDTTASNPRLAQLKEQQKALEFVVKSQEGYAAAQANSKKINEEGISAQQVMNKYLDAGTTAAEKRGKAQEELNKQIAANAKAARATQSLPKDQRVQQWSDADIAKARAGIEKLYADPKTPKAPAIQMPAGDRTLLNYKAQGLILDDTIAKLKESGDIQVRNTEYSKVHSHFIELAAYAQDNLLSAQEKSQLANQKTIELAAKEVDKKNEVLEAQKKINGLAKTMQDEQLKFQAQINSITNTSGMSSLQRQKYTESQQARLEFEKGGGSLSDTGARSTQEYLATLDKIDEKYAKLKASQGDWMSGASGAFKDWMDEATNSSKSAGEVINVTMGGAIDSLVDTLNGSTSSWKSWGLSVIKIIEKVAMELVVANSLKAALDGMAGSSTGWVSSLGSSLGGAVAKNANGGVYETPGLHKYVNQIHDSPQYFTFQGASKFAQGGVFAEAGPEAVMPLRRDASGRLGVMAHGGASGGVQPQININVSVDNRGNATSNTSGDGNAAARSLGKQIEGVVLNVVLRESKTPGLLGKIFVRIPGT